MTRVVVDERRLTLGVGTGFALDPAAIPKLQSLTKNRFRFAEGKIVVDLPTQMAPAAEAWMPLLRALLESALKLSSQGRRLAAGDPRTSRGACEVLSTFLRTDLS